MARHRLRNLLDSALLLGGMGLLLLLLGRLLLGPAGMWIAGGALATVALLSPRVAPWVMLRTAGARALAPVELPGLHALVAELAARAGLDRAPQLHYVPSPVINALSVGDRHEAAIGVTDGLLRRLSAREVSGVLAHETSHIAHRDLRVMALAEVTKRLTSALSTAGRILVLLNLPLVLAGAAHVSWPAILVLLFAPLASSLMQLALSRSREFDADLGAVGLTGDPAALAAALMRIERSERSLLDLLWPGRAEPSLLRTHPAAEARVRRLLQMSAEEGPEPASRLELEPRLLLLPEAWPAVGPRRRPPLRWR